MLSPLLRRYTWNSNWLYNVRIFIALCGTVALPWWLNDVKLTIPLTLGVVAGALADLDDRLAGRLRNLVITLVCFFIASASVELLFPWPWLFALGLTVSTSGFILLGGLGQRYATIAFGALLIAIYTMLGVSLYEQWYQQPVLLLLGAIWYNLLTLTGHLIFPVRALQDNIARSYEQLAHYLELKSRLFDPDIEEDSQAPLYDLALANGQLVATLNQTKASLLTRLRGDRGQRGTRRTLHYYFVAQDIHERASSSHVQYADLREKFRYSDVMFRFQRLLSMQSQACQQLARSILLRTPYQHDPRFERAFSHQDAALDRVQASGTSPEQFKALGFLLNNLRAIDAQLATIESEQAMAMPGNDADNQLADDSLNGFSDMWLRLSRHFTPESALFRHAVRMSLVLCVGYAFIQITGLHHGYWILLTSLFVCQPNYNATRHRLALRIVGTLVGVAIGLPVLYFVPSVEGQLILIVITGVLFFAFRNVQYAHATMFITLLVLLCFNLLGEGFEVALPRVIDTLIGCAIAWAAVSFIWPDWRFRNLPRVSDRAMNANCRYLDAILEQYHQGRDNRLAYRIARRDAHNTDAELASVVSNMSTEPRATAEIRETAFRLLCLNHTFTSYISTLGAHREKLTNPDILALLDDAVCYVDDALHHQPADEPRVHQALDELVQRIAHLDPGTDNKAPLVLQQIGLLIALLPEICRLRQQIATWRNDGPATQAAH
ncbi:MULTISPECIES: YccS family putative transporter [Enterobacter cloacae complex]|uniref:YccS family putative transporter n=1 Tax=Enterobacter cloacae complex TaxID=354276 RepID=UPI000651D37B|nr:MULTISPECIES: YccS family putative transporter [Enterobacter cloacae complex]KLW40372.1 inner membrane protein YccS [Enterobacter sp. MGH119]MBT1739896.1 TIGR01666 family membrane protein [Enterobacter hormaechei subsp. xiangfangensis]MCW4827713.1 YccS family putative transporter [Enterobacter hormaechei subsp. xiangfangensis]MCW4963311.1 YccS family putative transporter [Enterobacter hormaechei subsp. xiangfangensis]HCM9487469.1 TIGR01666 family membrane protein [Enterobacter hormaechei su